jgi:hypothetical protein
MTESAELIPSPRTPEEMNSLLTHCIETIQAHEPSDLTALIANLCIIIKEQIETIIGLLQKRPDVDDSLKQAFVDEFEKARGRDR